MVVEVKEKSSKSSGSFAQYFVINKKGYKVFYRPWIKSDFEEQIYHIKNGEKCRLSDILREYIYLKMCKGSSYVPQVKGISFVKYKDSLRLAIVMEHIEGETLHSFVKKNKLDSDCVLDEFESYVDDVLHPYGIFIRDWHDENVMVRKGTTKKDVYDNDIFHPDFLVRIDFSSDFCRVDKSKENLVRKMVKAEANKLLKKLKEMD